MSLTPQHYQSSSGSRNFGEGGPRDMKYKPPCSSAIFIGLFLQAGGHGPLPPSLDPLLQSVFCSKGRYLSGRSEVARFNQEIHTG